MLFLVQLAVLALILFWRRRRLLGRHLGPGEDASLGGYLSHVSTSRRGVVSRQIGLLRQRTFPLVVVPERWFHRLLKRFGLAAELTLGDAAIDGRWFIITDDPERLRRAVASPGLRAELTALLSLRLSGIRTAGDRVWFEVASVDLKRPDRDFREHLEVLGKVQDSLSALRLDAAGGEVAGPSRRTFAYLGLGLHAGLLAAALAGLALALSTPDVTVDRVPLLAGGLLLGSLAAAAWLALVSSRLRGTAWLTWLLADFALTGLAGFLLGGVLLVRAANIEFDSGEPQPVSARVLTRTCALECKGSSRRSGTTRHQVPLAECSGSLRGATLQALRLQSSKCAHRAAWRFRVGLGHWRPGWPPLEFEASASTWDGLESADHLEVALHPGAFGLEWVEPSEFKLPRGER